MPVKLPEKFKSDLGPDMKMDVHWIDVKLKDNRVLKNLVVRGRTYITGRIDDECGEGELPFESEDIVKIRRHSIFPFF